MKPVLYALALMLPVALHAEEIEVATAKGPVSVEQSPSNIVVLDLAAIDTLSALGVAVAGAPEIAPPAYLTDIVGNATKVGTLFEPDFETLASMGPDLIIAGGRSQTQVGALSKVAPTLDMTIDAGNLIAQSKERIDSYGKLFEKEAEATELQASLDEALATAQAAVKDKGNALVVLTNGGKMSAYGAGSRFGWLHSELGLPEAHPGIEHKSQHGEAISFEFIADTNPDWLLVIDRGAAVGAEGQAAAATLDNPLVAGTNAAKNDQIVYLDAGSMYLVGGGYQSLTGLLVQITEAFEGTD